MNKGRPAQLLKPSEINSSIDAERGKSGILKLKGQSKNQGKLVPH